ALAIIFSISGFTLFKWKFPTFVDIYYHLSVMRGFDMANGIVLHDFWEFAPVGRPHLYPPLIHIIMLFLYRLGLDVLTIGKIMSFSMFPLSLITVWFFMREIFDTKSAFYSVLLLSIPFQWFWSQTTTNAIAFVLILTPLIFYFIEKEKKIASIVLMVFSLYSHLSMPHIITIALLIYGFHRKEKRNMILTVLGVSYLLYLPWGLHILKNLDVINPGVGSLFYVEFHIILLLLALFGIYICYKNKGEYYLLSSLFFAMLLILLRYPFRFCFHVILPMSMLGGISIAMVHDRISENRIMKKIDARYLEILLMIFIIFALNLGNFTLYTTVFENKLEFTVEDTTIFKVMDYRPNEKMVIGWFMKYFGEITDKDVFKLIEIVRANTEENDIIFTNEGTYGCFITSFTGRRQTGAMFREFLPKEQLDYSFIDLVVLHRIGEEDFKRIYEKLEPGKRPPSLIFLDRIDDIKVYGVKKEVKKRNFMAPSPVISINAAMFLFLLGILLIFLDVTSLSSKLLLKWGLKTN
ncbi:MAG: hypothetical protein ACE5K4_08245, partial [Candidatus Hydrothermarchaeota archaeon]